MIHRGRRGNMWVRAVLTVAAACALWVKPAAAQGSYQDVVVVNENAGTAVVLANSHHDSFVQVGDALNAGTHPNFVMMADVDEDGIQDLLAVNGMAGGEKTLSVLRGQGQGVFEDRETVDLGFEAANSLAAGDFNQDGHQDLLVPNWYPGGSVQILLGDGLGGFFVSENHAVPGRANAVGVGDFNQDGNPDGVVCNWDVAAVTLLYGDGNGGIVSDQMLSTGTRPQSVRVADLDQDGDEDLVLSCALNPSVTVFWNNGGGTFTRQEILLNTDLGGAGIVRLGDLDHDGFQDLVTFSRRETQWFVSVFLWNSRINAFEELQQDSDIETLTYTPNAMEIADVTGDGHGDLILGDLARQQITAYPGRGDGTFDRFARFEASSGGTPVGLATTDFHIDAEFPDLDQGLILKYSFSDDHGAVVLDESGNGHDAVVQGASFIADGRMGSAYHFDGVNDVILTNDDLGFQPVGTIAFWMKADTIENWRNPFSTDYAGWDDNIRFEETADGVLSVGALGLSTVTPFPNGVYEEIYTDALEAGRWYHVIYAWDEVRDYGYLDGQLVFSTLHPSAGVKVHPNLPLTAGQYRQATLDFNRVAVGNGYSQSADRYWKGDVDEVRIYNRVISSGEAAALYGGASGGVMYQDFEPNNGSDPYGWSSFQSAVGLASDPEGSPSQVWRMEIPSGGWGATCIASQIERWNFNLHTERYDRLSFWIWASPSGGAADLDQVEVKFYTQGGGVDVAYTGGVPKLEEWTRLDVLFPKFASGEQSQQIDKIELIYGHSGVFYFDNLHVTLGDRLYQTFEPWRCPEGSPDACGWAWNGQAAVVSDLVHEGVQSWKLTAENNPLSNPYVPGSAYSFQQAGTGIQSQTEVWNYTLSPSELDPQQHDALSFWVYSLAQNGMSNNIFVKFFDHGAYHEVPAQFWTEKNAEYGQWSHLDLPLSKLPGDFNLDAIDKIEFEVFWPGEYYFDDIRSTDLSRLEIDRAHLSEGLVSWSEPLIGAVYTLEQSVSGPEGPWTSVYSGHDTQTQLTQLESCWLRARWQIPGEAPQIARVSDWSDPVPYVAKPVLIDHARLQQGFLEWSTQPLAESYEVERGSEDSGEWTQIYSGPQTTLMLSPMDLGMSYRVLARGPVDAGDWSPALTYNPQVFVKADGLNLRDQNGQGDPVQLKGVNLGNYLLLEPWMLGSGPEFDRGLGDPDGKYFDDWTIRDYLGSDAQEILDTYQEAYITDEDFDRIMRMGMNYIRLPLYYRNICDLDSQGQWTCGGDFNFDRIDAVVKACADRGIYVLLDLHGAPGGQGPEFHTGRTTGGNYVHQLFDPAVETYRDRTAELWNRIATHYKNNPAVIGYDLLNEPTGFEDYAGGIALLHDLYDRLYHEIRDAAGDQNHVVVMEGAWDWDSLPRPSDKGWDNVMYQFHYYCWEPQDGTAPVLGESCPSYDPKYLAFIPGMTLDDVVAYHRAFIDAKVDGSRQIQEEYDVPVLIGEFNGFGMREAWAYYLSRFNAEGWNWSLWSYKVHSYANSWGLYSHFLYNETLPDFEFDSRQDLERKLAQYDTGHHVPNQSLIRTVTENLNRMDYDGDGLSDAVDLEVLSVSDSFHDGSAEPSFGTIVSRGDQAVDVEDDPEALRGVRIRADEDGGLIPAQIHVCASDRSIFLMAGAEVIVTCDGSRSDIDWVSGPRVRRRIRKFLRRLRRLRIWDR